jgi:magnesium-transporting ATPase (P-type)
MELNDEIVKNLEEKIENCNNDMLRTIYICYKDIEEKDFNNLDEEIDTNDLVLLGIFGIRDTIRKGVKEAVLKCREASINVIMVTGDNIQTAHSIAKECNIIGQKSILETELPKEEINLLNNPPIEINGDMFYEIIGGVYCSTCNKTTNFCKCPKTYAEAELLSSNFNLPIQPLRNDKIKNIDNFKKITSKLRIMARSKPIHKYALVLGLKELNYIVAVTGDGTNDAPALSKSDVGFSMFDGTDIAKNSSDIILMDNNFSSIVTAIKYGRNVIDNLRKFIQFQLVINLTVCSFIVICSYIGSQTPIRSIQMLWIDLIMDSLATLTLATEPPHDGLLQRKPTKRSENIINATMIKHVTFQTALQFIILMTIYLYGPKFIKEQDLSRIAENQMIFNCYGILPGGENDPNNIIYGIKTYWPNFIEINWDIAGKGMCGEYSNYDNLSKAFKLYNKNQGAPVQLTMIFNIFVLYTLFNQLNCRVIDGNKNIFARIKNNKLFIIIEIFEFTVQFIIIEYWHIVFKATKNGLTITQWGICIFLSSLSLLLDYLLKIKK